MSIVPQLTLYDIAGVKGTPLSPFTWQIRLALNYKRLPFKTVWLEMVDIKPTMKKLGTSPSVLPAEPNGFYTVPVLVDETFPGPPKVISESLIIAEYLDETYPERPIFPQGTKALLELYDSHLKQKILFTLIPLLIPKTLPLLAERNHAYFRETRERWFGAKLEDLCPTVAKREECLDKLRAELDYLAKLLDKNGEGSLYALGNQVSRGDFVLIGVFVGLSETDHDAWEKVKSWNEGRWERLWDSSEEWRLNIA